jgi:hypothetical protein
MRLLKCLDCSTTEQLPDPPPGLDPTTLREGDDPLLDHLVARHHDADGRPHHGQMFAIADEDWRDEDRRKEILTQMGIKTTGLPGEFYDVKDTFQEDALVCFAQHKRPQGYCIDWCSDHKRLGRPTKEGRAWERLASEAPPQYLCQYCPVASTVMQAQRAKRGDYDPSNN